MSKFSDIVDVWWQSFLDSNAFDDEHRIFAGKLIKALRDHLEIPDEAFDYWPIDTDPEPKTRYADGRVSGI